MKKIAILFIAMITIANYSLMAQVAISANNSEPDASALLDVISTAQGLLLPRMTTEQRDVISAPAEGLMIFNTTTNCINFYTGTKWFKICGNKVALPPQEGGRAFDNDSNESGNLSPTRIVRTNSSLPDTIPPTTPKR